MQESWLRWADVDHGAVRDPRAYLVRDRDPPGPQPAARPCHAARGVRRASGSPSRCSRARTSPTTSSSPRTCRSRCSPCSRRWRRPSARCSCCARCSTSPYDEIAEAVGKTPGGGAPDRASRAGARHGATPADAGRPGRAQEVVDAVRRPRSTPATCRRSWTCWRPTSSRSPTAAVWCAARRAGRSSAPTSSRATSSAASRSSSCPSRAPRSGSTASPASGSSRWRARRRRQPRHRGRPHHPRLLDREPREARLDRCRDRARAVVVHERPARQRAWPKYMSSQIAVWRGLRRGCHARTAAPCSRP